MRLPAKAEAVRIGELLARDDGLNAAERLLGV
jgi:hypothetical protein